MIGKFLICKIVFVIGMVFWFIDYGIYIVNCYSSFLVFMIEKWCIGVVWKLCCVYVIYKMKKK